MTAQGGTREGADSPENCGNDYSLPLEGAGNIFQNMVVGHLMAVHDVGNSQATVCKNIVGYYSSRTFTMIAVIFTTSDSNSSKTAIACPSRWIHESCWSLYTTTAPPPMLLTCRPLALACCTRKKCQISNPAIFSLSWSAPAPGACCGKMSAPGCCIQAAACAGAS